MRFKGFTIAVTTPLNNDGPGYGDPTYTVVHGRRFGRIAHQGTIYATFSSRVKARAAATTAARQWIEEQSPIVSPFGIRQFAEAD